MTTTIEHVIDADHGTVKAAVAAIAHPCGLLTYRIPDTDDFEPDTEYAWRIGHHSGLCAAVALTEQDAIEAVSILADLTDWTASAATVKAALPDGLGRNVWIKLRPLDVVPPRYRCYR